MNLCSTNHEEICFEGHRCPFCDAKDEHAKEVTALKDDLASATGELEDTKAQLAACQEGQ